MHRAVFTVQKVIFCTEVYGGSDHRMYATAIEIQSTFQRLRESCLLHLLQKRRKTYQQEIDNWKDLLNIVDYTLCVTFSNI